MSSRREICELLDKLVLESFDLIEQDIQTKISIEKTANAGQLLMAKARYIQGHNSVSEAQLPTENSQEFKSLVNINHDVDELNIPQMEQIDNVLDKEQGLVDPVKWFGVLVPRSLQLAKDKYKKAIELSVEAANVRTRLAFISFDIFKLQQMKKELE